MNIIFANKKLEKYANDFSLAQRKLGNNQAILLHKRLNDLYDAENFSVLFYLPGHHHPLTENRSGQWACNLEQPSRLIYKPIIPDELVQSEEQIDLVQLVELSVIEITDYHDKKSKDKTMAINQYIPTIVFHPAETLREKLEEMGMGIKEFALRTGKPEKTIIAVLNEESSLTPEMAVLFENVTKIPASFWINKQARFNEFIARKRYAEAIAAAAEWAKEFPYAEMAKLNWVAPTRNVEEKTVNLLSYFGVASHIAWEKLYMESELKVAAYTSLKHTREPHAISAWLRQGELQAKQINAPVFDVKKLKSNIPVMRQLMVKQPANFFPKLQELCLQAGVVSLFTPKLPKVPLSGSTRWLNDTPLIQLTARYKRNDNFWFTFFHKLGHIILHGKKYISLENVDFAAADPKKEEEANQFAIKHTFTHEQEKEVLQKQPLYENDIIEFAKKFNTHPAMIIGRLQHDNIIHYSIGRQFMEPIDLNPQPE